MPNGDLGGFRGQGKEGIGCRWASPAALRGGWGSWVANCSPKFRCQSAAIPDKFRCRRRLHMTGKILIYRAFFGLRTAAWAPNRVFSLPAAEFFGRLGRAILAPPPISAAFDLARTSA